MSSFFVQSLLIPVSWLDSNPYEDPPPELVGTGTFALNLIARHMLTKDTEGNLIPIGFGRNATLDTKGLIKLSETGLGNSVERAVTEKQMTDIFAKERTPSFVPNPTQLAVSHRSGVPVETFTNPGETFYYNQLVVGKDNSLFGWGVANSGSLAQGIGAATAVYGHNPISIPGYTQDDIKRIDRLHLSVYVLMKDKSLWVWGENSNGQLGLGNTTDQWIPVKGHENVDRFWVSKGIVYAQDRVNVIIEKEGKFYIFGRKSTGPVNGNDTSSVPLEIPQTWEGESHEMDVWSMGSHLHAFLLQNRVTKKTWAAGWNGQGSLGVGITSGEQHSFLPTVGLPELGIVNYHYGSMHRSYDFDVVKSYGHGVTLLEDGTVWSCGSGIWNSLGLGDTVDRDSWEQVLLMDGGAVMPKVNRMWCANGSPSATFCEDENGDLLYWGHIYVNLCGLTTDNSKPEPRYIDWRAQINVTAEWMIKEIFIPNQEAENYKTIIFLLAYHPDTGEQLLAVAGEGGWGIHGVLGYDHNVKDAFTVCSGVPDHNNIKQLAFVHSVHEYNTTNNYYYDRVTAHCLYNNGEVWGWGANYYNSLDGMFGQRKDGSNTVSRRLY